MTDNTVRTATSTVDVDVVGVVPSTFSGFYSPVNMGEVNVIKAGRAVPMKFNVDQGGEVTDPSRISIKVYTIDCGWVTGIPQDEIEYSLSGGSELRWTGSSFHANVKLDGRRGTCRLVVASMNDGSGSVSAIFRLK